MVYGRMEIILNNALDWVSEVINDREELYRVLTESFGMNDAEIDDVGMDWVRY